MNELATSKEVAALAGVSQSTVSYVMSGRRSISAKTRAKVEAAMAELTYQPNAGARALASRRTSVIGLIVHFAPTTDMAGTLPFIETIASDARDHEYDVVLVTTDEGISGLQRLAGRSLVDAIVLMDIKAQDERLRAIPDLGVPVVLVGVPDEADGLFCVDVNFRRAGALAVEELATSGHRHVVVIGEPPEVSSLDYGFISGFQDGAIEAAERADVRLEVLDPALPGWPGIKDLASTLLQHRGMGLGIVARTPQVIGWVLHLLLQEGLEPGIDLSVVGLCTDVVAQSYSVDVTNVSPRPHDVSRSATRMVFELLDGGDVLPRIEFVEPRLTRRATTAHFD